MGVLFVLGMSVLAKVAIGTGAVVGGGTGIWLGSVARTTWRNASEKVNFEKCVKVFDQSTDREVGKENVSMLMEAYYGPGETARILTKRIVEGGTLTTTKDLNDLSVIHG